MSDYTRLAIKEMMQRLQSLLDEVYETKKAINTFAKSIGDPLPFPELNKEDVKGLQGIRPDEFFGKPLAGSVREYLEKLGHAAPVLEILGALKAGGFDFGNDEYAEKNLRISLGKNTQTFVQVKGSDSFGLLEFYPNLKREKADTAIEGEVKPKLRIKLKPEFQIKSEENGRILDDTGKQ